MLKRSMLTSSYYSKSIPRLSSIFSCKFLLHSQSFALSKHKNNDLEFETPLSPKLFTRCSPSPNLGSFQLDNSMLYSLIHNYAMSADLHSLDMGLDQIKSKSWVLIKESFIVFFRAYGKAHLPNKFVDLFHQMLHDFHYRPTVKSFDYVLNVIIQQRHFSYALDFYYSNICKDNKLNINISPNMLTFNLVIKAMCKLGLVDKAIQDFREIPPRNCIPDVFTYSTLMDGLCKEPNGRYLIKVLGKNFNLRNSLILENENIY